MFAELGLQAMRTMAFVGEFVPILPFTNSLWGDIVLLGKIHLLTITLSLDLRTNLWGCTGLCGSWFSSTLSYSKLHKWQGEDIMQHIVLKG